MVLDPLTAFSVAGTVIQFVDFGSSLCSESRQLYKSARGALSVNEELELATTSIISLLAKLHRPLLDGELLSQCASEEEQALLDISKSCQEVGAHLLERLNHLKVQGTRTKWKSFRKAIEASMSKEELKSLVQRFSSFKETLQSHILVGLR